MKKLSLYLILLGGITFLMPTHGSERGGKIHCHYNNGVTVEVHVPESPHEIAKALGGTRGHCLIPRSWLEDSSTIKGTLMAVRPHSQQRIEGAPDGFAPCFYTVHSE